MKTCVKPIKTLELRKAFRELGTTRKIAGNARYRIFEAWVPHRKGDLFLVCVRSEREAELRREIAEGNTLFCIGQNAVYETCDRVRALKLAEFEIA